jgi:hypothetical protein
MVKLRDISLADRKVFLMGLRWVAEMGGIKVVDLVENLAF